MAAGIAESLLANAVIIDSAGTNPKGNSPTEEAVQVMKNLYHVDISSHTPKPVSEANPLQFDFIIAMDSSVYAQLKAKMQIPEEKLYGWDIEDPLGLGIKAYEATAKKIQKRLEQFLINREIERKFD